MWISFETDTPSGGTIVLTAIGVFVLVATAGAVRRPRPRISAMCMQCVAEGVTYVGGRWARPQVLKVRARSSRRRLIERTTCPTSTTTTGAQTPPDPR